MIFIVDSGPLTGERLAKRSIAAALYAGTLKLGTRLTAAEDDTEWRVYSIPLMGVGLVRFENGEPTDDAILPYSKTSMARVRADHLKPGGYL